MHYTHTQTTHTAAAAAVFLILLHSSHLLNSALKLSLVGRIIAPKHVHLLIHRTCEYTILHGKRDLADVINI